MSEVVSDLLYTRDHEWIMVEENIVTVGITDHAQAELGDITFVELPEEDTDYNAGDEVCTVESVKAASPVYAPVSGKVFEANAELEDEPGAINSDAYGAGWIYRMELGNESDLDDLLSAEDYESFLAEND